MEEKIKLIFETLNQLIDQENTERREDGRYLLKAGEIRILGQMSLLLNEKVSSILTLAQTADMDAKITLDYFVKSNLKKLLVENGFIYDEDSDLVWIPPHASFIKLYEFRYLTIYIIDPESALVSKAVKAPKKNEQLIADAIATGKFPGLEDRILKEGGSLENFI